MTTNSKSRQPRRLCSDRVEKCQVAEGQKEKILGGANDLGRLQLEDEEAGKDRNADAQLREFAQVKDHCARVASDALWCQPGSPLAGHRAADG